MVAADRGNDEIVELLLNMTNIDVNAKDDMNRTALWLAVDGLMGGLNQFYAKSYKYETYNPSSYMYVISPNCNILHLSLIHI